MARETKKASEQERLWFLKDVLQNQIGYKEALDGKANVLLGVSGIIFGLVITQINGINYFFRLGALALLITSGISALLCIWTIKMPFARNSVRQKLMCFTGFTSMKQDEYFSSMKRAMTDIRMIEEEYLTEIYGLAKNSIEPKYGLVKLSTSILTIGIIVSFLLFLVSVIVG